MIYQSEHPDISCKDTHMSQCTTQLTLDSLAQTDPVVVGPRIQATLI